MKRNRISIVFLTMLTFGLFFAACDDIGKVAADILFTDQDDVTLGQQVVSQINADTKTYPIWNDGRSTEVKYYLNNTVLTELLKSPVIEKKGVYQYHIEVIKDTILNAFALPGGPIYVYTGLLKYLTSESALAGVIGHEIAHAERRHAAQRMAAQYGLQMLMNVVLGQNPSTLAQIGANLLSGIALLQNSQLNETESDDYSFKYLKGTKYYPGSVKFFFEQMQADGLVSASGKVEAFFSTHPDPLSRIAGTNTRLTNDNITVIKFDDTASGINLYRTEYQNQIWAKLP
ncbi:MAG: M48 family metalloprotease [Ignavibacteriales bacterium]|nr:M48 family metalloprotease [Ignavibacteriales bacterium]